MEISILQSEPSAGCPQLPLESQPQPLCCFLFPWGAALGGLCCRATSCSGAFLFLESGAGDGLCLLIPGILAAPRHPTQGRGKGQGLCLQRGHPPGSVHPGIKQTIPPEEFVPAVCRGSCGKPSFVFPGFWGCFPLLWVVVQCSCKQRQKQIQPCSHSEGKNLLFSFPPVVPFFDLAAPLSSQVWRADPSCSCRTCGSSGVLIPACSCGFAVELPGNEILGQFKGLVAAAELSWQQSCW